ncbi:MAG TPA: hypothetical protein VIF09_21330 [Polyangiaceae bacterium]
MRRSIRNLYAYALAEGEGVGTAYEYYVKRRVMRPLLAGLGKGGSVLVAGLPEKYGTSLDFVLAAGEREARVLVVDDRPAALQRARSALADAARAGMLSGAQPELRGVTDIADLAGVGPHDVVLSCEVVQRLEVSARRRYVRRIRSLAPLGVVFAPNSENGSHLAISGLGGLDRRTLADLFDGTASELGFVDLPPFPPGIKRSEVQRARASTGRLEAVAMRGLELYSAVEPLLPSTLKRHVAHIAYAVWREAPASRR